MDFPWYVFRYFEKRKINPQVEPRMIKMFFWINLKDPKTQTVRAGRSAFNVLNIFSNCGPTTTA